MDFNETLCTPTKALREGDPGLYKLYGTTTKYFTIKQLKALFAFMMGSV
jgi:hypothetical protein